MKKAILIASFGTTNEAAIQSCILPLEQAASAAFPEYTVHRCFTSDMVIRHLSRQGISVDSLEQALHRLICEGYRQVAILPTMLTDGSEYRKLLRAAAFFQPSFCRLTISKPLLYHTEDLETVAAFIHTAFPLQEHEALLLMGHGTVDSENKSLCTLAQILQHTNHRLFLAALEGSPAVSQTIQKISGSHCSKVLLAPLMLTAGTHVVKHLSGTDQTSWQCQCQAAGLTTRCQLSGLGAYLEIQKLYLRHLSASLAEN